MRSLTLSLVDILSLLGQRHLRRKRFGQCIFSLWKLWYLSIFVFHLLKQGRWNSGSELIQRVLATH
jgi:hypothetical protein